MHDVTTQIWVLSWNCMYL